MRAWLIYGREDARRNQAFIEMHHSIGKKLDMEIELLYAEDISLTVEQGEHCLRHRGKWMERPEVVLCRTRDYWLTRQLEHMGIPVCNNSEVSLVGNNKALACQEVAALSVPIVDTCFCRHANLWETLWKLPADEKGDLITPTVIKAVSGHGGSQVFLYENREQVEGILLGMAGEDAVIQPRILGNGNAEDLRVYVVGNKVKGCVLRKAKKGSFRSNFSLGGSISPYSLSKDETALVETFLHRWHFDFAGIDFIRDARGQLLFNEIEDVVGSRMYYQCYGDDILFHYLNYVRDCYGISL